MKLMGLILITLMSSTAFAEQNYGKGAFTSEPVKLATIIKDFSQYDGKTVVTEGKVFDVCTKEGCWLKIKDGNSQVRVVLPHGSFTVPKEIKNKTVKVEGVMEHKEMPASAVKHYLKDEGKSQAEIDKVTGPEKVFQFKASGVKSI